MDSSFKEMERLEPFVKSLQASVKFDEETFSRVLLTLSEAVNNAIIHGNNQDPDKQVVVHAQLDKQVLIIRVRDEGAGFDPSSLPDPLKEENLLNEGGRGIYLIRQYADDVKFGKGGAEITFTFQLGD